jgi:hypothetical protein
MFSVKYLYLIALLLIVAGCQKELNYQTASDQLVNKVWFLEKIVYPSFSYNYSGVPTFSFKLDKSSNSYRDSDGIDGDFTIKELPQVIWVEVSSATRVIESYKITQLEKNHFVAEIVKNNLLQILYFSTRP